MHRRRVNRFNIVKQSKDYDADGAYVRHWLPELKDVPAQFVHEPWKMSRADQERCAPPRCTCPPAPFVPCKPGRARTLDPLARGPTCADGCRIGSFGDASCDYPNPPKSVFQYSNDGGGKGKGGGRGGGRGGGGGGGGGGRNVPQTPAQAAAMAGGGRGGGKGRGGGRGGGRKRLQQDYVAYTSDWQ